MKHSSTTAALLAPVILFCAASARSTPVAHADAATGQADAARIEACTNATNALIDHLQQGDFKAATSGFDANMQAGLSAARLATVWQDVGHQFGALQNRGMPQNVMYQGRVVIILPLQFQKNDLNAQVACDADGRITGFYLRPAGPSLLDTTTPPASAPPASH